MEENICCLHTIFHPKFERGASGGIQASLSFPQLGISSLLKRTSQTLSVWMYLNEDYRDIRCTFKVLL